MKNTFSVSNLSKQTRLLNMYPKVLRAGCMEHEKLIHLRKIKNLQICFRLCGTTEKMQTIVNGRNYEAGFPHLLIKRPGEIHENTDSPINFSTFYFTYPADSPVLEMLPPQLVMAQIPFDGNLPGIFNMLQTLLDYPDNSGACDRIDELCYRFLFELVIMWKNSTVPSPNPESRIGQAVFWLRCHCTGNIDWEKIAEKFGFSMRSFCRHWRNAMKESPGESLWRFRMEEAKQLLTESSLSVAELGYRFGYSSPEAFIKAFRRYTDMTPLAFRKITRRHIADDAEEYFSG